MSAKAIRSLISRLRNRDESVRLDSLDGLARFGPLAFEGVEPVIKLLEEYNVCLRARAVNALGKMGPTAAAALPKLNTLLGDHVVSVRTQVRRALQRIGPVGLPEVLNSFLYETGAARVQAAQALAAQGPDAALAVPYLVTALTNKDMNVRVQAARTLATIGMPIPDHMPAVIAILKKQKDKPKAQLVEALASFPAVAKVAVPILRKMALKIPKNPKLEVRPAAIQALGKLGAAAKAAIPELMVYITGEDNPLRSAAIVAIGRMGPAAAEVVPEFVKRLPTAGEKRSLLYVDALGKIGPAADPSIPALLQMLPESYGTLRERITIALASMGPKAVDAIPYFTKALGESSAVVRFDALRALRQLGPVATEALPAVLTALQDPDMEVRHAAMQAFAAMPVQTEQTTDELKKRIADRDPRTRRLAIDSLQRFGYRDPALESQFREALNSPYAQVRYEAADFLWQLTDEIDASMPVWREAIVDRDRSIRQHTLMLLCEVARKHPSALTVLIQALRNPDEPLNRPAANALIAFGKNAIPAMQEALNDPAISVRSGALSVLSRLGDVGAAVRDQVLAALDDHEMEVRWSAVRAIGAIGGDSDVIVPKLVPLLDDESPIVRSWTALALAQLGDKVVPHLEKLLQRGSAAAQIAACDILAKIGPVGLPIVGAVGPLLREEDDKLRTAAERAMNALCRDIEAELKPVLRLLESSDRSMQEWAALELAQRGADVVPLLLRMLAQNNDEDVLWGASETITLIGPSAEAAAPLLLRNLEELEDSEVQNRVAKALAAMGAGVVPLLTTSLSSKSADVRLGATDAIARIGSAAVEAAPVLVNLLADSPMPGLQRFYAETLGEIGEGAMPSLAKELGLGMDVTRRGRIIHALGVIGRKSSPLISAILPYVDHEEPSLRVEALWAISRIPPTEADLPAVLESVSEALLDATPAVRDQAALTLGRLGVAATGAIAHILPALNDDDTDVRLTATLALGEIARAAKGSSSLLGETPKLLAILEPLATDDPAPLVRGQALRTLAAVPGDMLSRLKAGLADRSLMVQIRAIDALSEIGEPGYEVLRQLLNDPQAVVRRIALQALIEANPKDIITLLGSKLSDDDWQVAERAAKELLARKEAAAPVMESLLLALRSRYKTVRQCALTVAKHFDGEGVLVAPALVEAIVEQNQETREWALNELTPYPTLLTPAIPLLIVLAGEVVANGNWRYPTSGGRSAANLLRLIGEPVVPLLKQAIQQPNERLRLRAIDSLEHVHAPAYAMLKPYRKQMDKPTPDVIEKINEAFADYAGPAMQAIPALIMQLKDRQGWRTRWDAAIALGKLAKDNKLGDEVANVVAGLMENLKDQDYDVREKTAEALGLIGPGAGKATTQLFDMMKDTHPRVRTSALVALGRLGDSSSIKVEKLIKLLDPKNFDANIACVVLEMLSAQGKKAAKALPSVIACAKNSDVRVRTWALWGLAELGGKKKEALDAVTVQLDYANPRVIAWAAYAHAKLTSTAETAMSAIRRVLSCRDADTRTGSLATCRLLGDTALPFLQAACQHEWPQVREGALAVMAGLQSLSERVLPTMTRLAETDHTESVRLAAVTAIKELKTTSEVVVLKPKPS